MEQDDPIHHRWRTGCLLRVVPRLALDVDEAYRLASVRNYLQLVPA